jgi:hypothetical protein
MIRSKGGKTFKKVVCRKIDWKGMGLLGWGKAGRHPQKCGMRKLKNSLTVEADFR